MQLLVKLNVRFLNLILVKNFVLTMIDFFCFKKHAFKEVILSVSLFALSLISYCQEEGYNFENVRRGFDKDRIYFGGNLGSFQFGQITSFDLSPMIGYRLTDKFSTGIGVSYQYFRSNPDHFTTDIYGGRIIGNYIINDYLIAQAEGEVLSLESKYFILSNQVHDSQRFLNKSVYVGGGYKQNFGEHSFTYIVLLYNILYSADSHLGNPIIRVGFNF